MADILTSDLAARILYEVRAKQRADIFTDTTEVPFEVQTLTLTLTTAKTTEDPYPINFPFRSVFIRDATDASVSVKLKPSTRNSYQSTIDLRLNDSWGKDRPISSASLSWDAQSGKTITLVFFVESEFRSGSQVSQNAGGVSISDGTAFTTARVALTAATATSVFATSSTRKKGTIQNTTGASIWVGDSTVTNSGSTMGLEVPTGGIFYWNNSAALYAYSVLASTVTTMTES